MHKIRFERRKRTVRVQIDRRKSAIDILEHVSQGLRRVSDRIISDGVAPHRS
jgi:hypothetical protein